MNNQLIKKQAKIQKKHSISPIWFLPFIAALLGAWIVFQHITHANVEIQIHFDNADSIIVDKTKIRYKGVIVGTVKKIQLDSAEGINIIAEIESHATFMLRQKTTFWLVSPKASLTSISGLDTLFSGSYINLQPGGGDRATLFNALAEQPISIPDNALLINLRSATADSISVGTPLFFKKIQVGEVAQVRLGNKGRYVNIKVFIEKKYSHLIKDNSKFWNISGLNANISLQGIDFKLDSLSSLIAGGITFSSPQDGKAISAAAEFELFESLDKTEMGLEIELGLTNITNLPKGAGIIFKGLGIGRITDIQYSIAKKQFVASAVINPQFSELVTEGAQFWLEKTSITFSKISNLSNIISGDYIAFSPAPVLGKKKKSTRFSVQEMQIPAAQSLSLILLTEDATGLSAGAPLSYQGIKIGKIGQVNFSQSGRFVDVMVNIDHQYQYVINKNSRFYTLNGVNFSASLKGINLQTSPLENIVSGGIGLYNPHPIKKSALTKHIDDSHSFRLYPSKALAKLGEDVFSKTLSVALLSKQLPSLSEGAPVYYHKLPIGEVAAFTIDDSSLIRTTLNIKGQYKHLISNNSIFWNISGFHINASLSGIKIDSESLLSVANGGIAVDFADNNVNNRYKNGSYKLFDSYQQAVQPTQTIKISFDQAYDLQVGGKLRLQGLVIGEISALSLTRDNKVQAVAQLQPQFAEQVAREGSRFWIVRSELSLNGAKNLSTLVTGVYLDVLPGNGEPKNKFTGASHKPIIAIKDIGLSLILLADNAGSTEINSPVYHRQIKIGEVAGKQLASDASGVEISINIYPEYAHLIRKNSIFWPASGFNLDIGITGASLTSTSLTSLIKGGISMSTPDDQPLQPRADSSNRFTVKKEMRERWLEWKLAIPQP
ncbi:MlaD family protein [Psychromonas antarctica]|uniref:MlaD family protein n=1 Tax=Psychromonas antarctica TaxID=67573 RepID=UPI001EE805AE|nr:MlaD family protein [Psychromonas antarctica]MCG6200442.1 MlaD family protein [Psychromonas antarctica]